MKTSKASRTAQYGFNPASGEWERCRAKAGNEGRYGCPHSKHQQMTAEDAEHINTKAMEYRAKNSTTGNGAIDKAILEPLAPETETITTVLTKKIPLRDDRVGEVPTILENDTPASIQSKISKYLTGNFDGDENKAIMQALNDCYPDLTLVEYSPRSLLDSIDRRNEKMIGKFPIPVKSSNEFRNAIITQIEDYKNKISAKSGDPDVKTYFDENTGRVIYVSNGLCNKETVFFNEKAKRGDLRFDGMNFGRLLSADAVMSRMDIDDASDYAKTRVADNLINTDSYTWWVDRSWSNPHSTFDDEARGLIMKRMEALQKTGRLQQGLNTSTDDDLRSVALKINEADPQSTSSRKIMEHVAAYDRDRFSIPNEYSKAVRDLIDDESNGILNYDYAKTTGRSYTTRLYESGKTRDSHNDLIVRTSSFATDFSKIEIDDRITEKRFGKMSEEWRSYRTALPPTRHKAEFSLRRTDSKRATGAYAPAYRSITVDPRYTPSTTHEYYHHWDFDSNDDGSQQSMSEDFRSIVTSYRNKIDRTMLEKTDPNRYLAPTEVLARAGELYTFWKNPGRRSSFLKSKRDYENRFDFAPLLPMRSQIIAFFDEHFNDARR